MKKGYYIVCRDPEGGIYSSGVEKKIVMQIKCFSQFFDIELIGVKEVPVSFWGKICRRLPFFFIKREYEEAFSQLGKTEFIYMRSVPLDREYVRFLRKIREKYPVCKIIVELPTYPYDKELSEPKFLPYLLRDRHYRMKYRKYIDRFVTYTTNIDEIFGVKTIETMNGVDIDAIKKVSPEKYGESVNLIFVGTMMKHHGLERVILGLKEYYEKRHDREVIIHCVGAGSELEYYKKLVEEKNLENKVLFYGSLQGEGLDKIYDKADVAISSLGLYKIGLSLGSFLKTREYLAKGLPIITGCPLDVFERYPCDFHVDFANDDSNIDIRAIINFYDNLMKKYEAKEDLVNCIRNYGKEHIDNMVVLKPVLDYISC